MVRDMEARGRRLGLDCGEIETNARRLVRHEQRRDLLRRVVGWRDNGHDHDPVTAIFDELSGPAGLTEKQTTFSRDGAIVAIACRLEGGAERVLAATDALLADRRVLSASDGRYTTVELVQAERRLIGRAQVLNGCKAPPVAPDRVERFIASRSFGSDQAQAVRDFCASTNAVRVIEAAAGSGKTTTAGQLAELLRQEGYTVYGAGPTSRAVRELSDHGVPARTLALERIRIENFGASRYGGPYFDRRPVLILDEHSMSDTRSTLRIIDRALADDCRILAIGDSAQVPSVGAGSWAKYLGDACGRSELREVYRQRDPAEREALDHLRGGRPDRYLAWADHEHRIHIANRAETVAATVTDWWQTAQHHGPRNTTMIAYTNALRTDLNVCARDLLGLGAERCYDRLELALGDRVILRHPDRRLNVDNGDLATVRLLGDQGIAVELDRGPTVALPLDYLEYAEHGYAITGHGLQGASIERPVVIAEPRHLTASWSYTALSRGRGETPLRVIDDGEGPGPVTLKTIERAMLRSDAHELASRPLERERSREQDSGLEIEL